jgi:predicted DNA-binding transcriptional regulator YafY
MTRTSGEPSALERLELILTSLDNDWQSYDSLSVLTGKPERTLRRDLERILAQGHPLEEKWDGRQKVFRLTPGSRKKPIEPGILEVIAVNLGRGLLGFLQGTELRDEMEGLFQQLRDSSRASERQLKDLDRKFWFMADAPRDYHGCDEQLNEIITCLVDQKCAVLEYRTRTRALEQVRVRPYTLIVRRECLYVLAAVEAGDGQLAPGLPRLFDLTRIETCRRLRSSFDLPAEWDPAGVFKDSFGVFIPREGEAPATRVEIWFEASVGRMIQRRRWHDSQKWTIAPEGGWRLELHVRVCPELIHWLVGFGPMARVITPAELRDAVVNEHRLALRNYEGEGG